MDMKSTAEQLRCAGVVAAVTISRVAFPNRLTHESAIDKFACLKQSSERDDIVDEKKQDTNDDLTDLRDSVTTLLTNLLKELETADEDGTVTKAFETGKSRVYFRTGAMEFLEAKRLVALGSFATILERIVRGYTARCVFWKLKYAAIDSQANARRTIDRKTFLQKRQACIVLECWARTVFAKGELKRLKRQAAAVRLQSRWRSIQAVSTLVTWKQAAVVIQKTGRGAMQRPKYRQALKEAEEEARVNSKLAALQKRLKEAEMKWIQADKQRIAAEKRAEGIVGSPEDVAASSADASSAPREVGDMHEEKKTDTPENQQDLIHESNE
jgi:myosin-5